MSEQVYSFVKEAANETVSGGLSRRDFFKYAALFGLSITTAGRLIGLTDAEAAEVAATIDWEKLEKESPFEIKNLLIKKAEEAGKKRGLPLLNAGRGNPDFLNTLVREAFALLTLFAARTAQKGSEIQDLGFRLQPNGLAEKLFAFLDAEKDDPAAVFLADAMEYAIEVTMLDQPEQAAKKEHRDQVVFQLTDAIQGDFYPDPPRIYPAVEAVVRRYLERVVFTGQQSTKDYHLFATEGATAAMIYIFNSLKENMVLNPGDKVAIITPIFSPYLELPVLRDYGLETVYIEGDEANGWQVCDCEVCKLRDKKIKALYMVNPTNPTSTSLDDKTVKGIAETIRKHNPNMVIISDTVYASFVDEFHTFGNELPKNILGVYSFSKYFGVTGWRLGVVMIHKNSVVDNIIGQLPQKDKDRLDRRYRLTSTDPETIRFYERLEMDSRQVALAHTGGLSGPQQVIMSLFATYELLDQDKRYKSDIMNILRKRWSKLFDALGLTEPTGSKLTRYYALIDLKQMAIKMYGEPFAEKLIKKHPLEFLFDLAREHCVVCLPGQGFAGPRWSLRVALANISEADCRTVGKAIVAVMEKYHKKHPQG